MVERRHSFTESLRQQESILAPYEKRALLWLACRTPPRVNSDHLTLLGLTGIVVAGLGYELATLDLLFLHLANFGIALNWFGDSLDGTLARYRHRQRPRYGFYVDHMVDTVGALCLVGGLAFSGLMSQGIAAAVLVAYFALSINSYLATHALGRFQLSFFGLSPTELRLLLIAGNLVLPYHPSVSLLGRTYGLFDMGGAVGVVAMAAIFATVGVRNVRALYRLEPLPERDGKSRRRPSPGTKPRRRQPSHHA